MSRTLFGLSILQLGEWVAALIAAAIMLQTLFFKFSAAEESVYIFSTLGAEPWGRIGSGVVELVASLLLVYPRTRWIGAFLGLGTMLGAILAHVIILGIVVQDDGGQLFLYALLVFACCAYCLFMEKEVVFSKGKQVWNSLVAK